MLSHPVLVWVVDALDPAGTSRRAASIRFTRTFVSVGYGTPITPSFSGTSSSGAVCSVITGICAFCGFLLPIAPTKASRTPSSTLGEWCVGAEVGQLLRMSGGTFLPY